jgi:hypothetical protein
MPASVRLEPILLKKPLVDTAKLMRGLERAIDDTTAIVDANFKATVESWKHKPKFIRRRATRKGRGIEGDVLVRDEIYGYVTGGTRKHVIRPKRARLLAFRGGYRAKTRRRVIGSHRGGAYGSLRFAKQVIHPGTEAREFQQEIAARRQRNLYNFAIRAWVEARR